MAHKKVGGEAHPRPNRQYCIHVKGKKKPNELARLSEEDWSLLELGDMRAYNVQTETRTKKAKKKRRPRKRK